MRTTLNGVLVVSLEQAVAAPYCSSRLADAGAEVLKIERPEGDFARAYDTMVKGQSTYFVWLNRGKKSVVIDIKNDADAALLHAMIAKADVFIQNLAPGAAARAGFGSDRLRAQNPRLITCDISGYGETGPYADMKAYDLLVQCETGLASITGTPEAPGRVGVSICDVACGMYAHTAILEALIARGNTGEGASLSVSLFSAMADWMTGPLFKYDYGGAVQERVGLNHATIAPYGVYRAEGGAPVMIAIQNDREWRRLCAGPLGNAAIADDPRFVTNTDRVENRDALDREINGAFSKQTLDTLRDALKSADIAYGAINDVAGLSVHPQLQRVSVETPNGTVDMPVPPVAFNGDMPSIGDVPALGAHTEEIKRRFVPTEA